MPRELYTVGMSSTKGQLAANEVRRKPMCCSMLVIPCRKLECGETWLCHDVVVVVWGRLIDERSDEPSVLIIGEH